MASLRLKQRKDSVDFQRMNRVEGLRSKLQHTNELKRLKEDANREMQTFLEAIKPAVLLFHSRIGCSDVHSKLLMRLKFHHNLERSNELIMLLLLSGDGGMKQVLGDIEEQIVSVLQAYHAKVESTKRMIQFQLSPPPICRPSNHPRNVRLPLPHESDAAVMEHELWQSSSAEANPRALGQQRLPQRWAVPKLHSKVPSPLLPLLKV